MRRCVFKNVGQRFSRAPIPVRCQSRLAVKTHHPHKISYLAKQFTAFRTTSLRMRESGMLESSLAAWPSRVVDYTTQMSSMSYKLLRQSRLSMVYSMKDPYPGSNPLLQRHWRRVKDLRTPKIDPALSDQITAFDYVIKAVFTHHHRDPELGNLKIWPID